MEKSRKDNSQVHLAQNSKAVHPTYDKYGTTGKLGLIKKLKGNSELISRTPVSLSKANGKDEIENFQNCSQNGSDVNEREHNGRRPSSEFKNGHSGVQKSISECPIRTQTKDSTDSRNANGIPGSSTEDNLNGNKKSSIEQKRFYHRKFSVIPGAKLSPVGRFFKLFRSPLERRNSCPVLSISEKDLTAAAAKNNTILKPQTTQIQPTYNTKKDSKNQKKRNCCLTKWVSHSELLQTQLNQRVIPLQSAIATSLQPAVVEPSSNAESNILSSSKSENHVSSLIVESNSPVIKINTDNPTTETSSFKLSNGNIDSFVVEKTVIIVSEKTALNVQNSEGINNISIPGEVSSIKQESLSMNNNYSHINVQSYTNKFELNQEQTIANQVKVLYANNIDNSVSVNNIQVSETKTCEISLDVGNQSTLLCDKIYCDNKTTKSIRNTEHGHQNSYSQPLTKSLNSNSTNINTDISDTGDHKKLCQNQINSIDKNLTNGDSEVRLRNKLNLNNHDNNVNDKSCDDYKIKTIVEFESNEKLIDSVKPPENSLVSTFSSDPNDTIIYATVSKIRKNKKQTSVQENIYLSERIKSKEYPSHIDTIHKESEKYNENNKSNLNFAKEDSILGNEQIIPINGTINKISRPNQSLNGDQDIAVSSSLPVNVVCNKETGEKCEVYDNICEKADIIVNCLEVQYDSLDFGENHLNSSLTDLQSNPINECYNVKLDAPEEVIVAGFHDFCHTMLSLEENLDSNDTGTIKRRPNTKEKKNKVTDTLEKNKLTSNQIEKYVTPVNGNNSQVSRSCEQSISPIEDSKIYPDKLLEEIQNSKLIEKMSIKDPDVIDAIRILDKSLMDESDDSVESDTFTTSIESTPSYQKPNPPQKVNKEDKIQCDNLIEELMLEDISKSVTSLSSKNSQNPFSRGNIAVTISNLTTEQILENKSFSSIESNINNSQSDEERTKTTEHWSKRSYDVNGYNRDELSSDAYESDFCEQIEDTKKVNLPEGKDDSFSPPVSIASDDTSSTFHVDHSPPMQDISPCNRTSPCSVDSGMSSHSQSYFVVVAIDFGTTYSGYAFCFTRDPDNIHMMKKWDGGDPGVFNQKTPTTLLLSPEGTFHSFGYSARDYYHDLDVEEAKNWLYFEKFKMTLHHSEHLTLDTEIAASNGKRVPAVTVFAHALSYFKDHALQELSDQSSTKILNEDVRWVVTVPAIWKQPAKQFMRAAAYKAGIACPEYPDQLLIALEPEAASIYCRRMKLHQLVPDETHFHRSSFSWKKECESERTNDKDVNHSNIPGQSSDASSSFSVGTRYMVVDCGGGTVDITVHQLLDEQGTLKELKKASGGPYGSIGVDLEFEKLLCDIFGDDFIQQFKAKRPTGYVDLMIAFESRKRNANPYKANPLNISLPFSFIDYYKKHKGSSVESAIKKSSHKNVKWSSQGMLRLESSEMERLFQNTVGEIRKHIDAIITEKDMNIDHIFLVGGFAESLILQKEIKDAFSSKLKVVIPQGVSLAILKGAVLFGLDPTAVNIRRLRMTYGVGILNRFIHGIHPREKLVIKDGIQWCADVFDKFVINEQSVGVGDVVVRRYTPAKDGQSCSVIHIYCSEKDNAYFITDSGVKRCATLILDLSDSRYVQDREIQTQMMFGDTEIKVSALDVTTGKCVKAEVDFLNQ